jgi:hypothetical protein
MLTLWSEVPGARVREVAADVGSVLWIALWIAVSRRLYATLAAFAGAGRFIGNGGRNLAAAGRQIGDALGGIPVIGHDVGDLVQYSLAMAARPFLVVGLSLERWCLFIALFCSATVLVLALVMWLQRYVPWRWTRLRRLRAAHRVVRASPAISGGELERLLASRALHRLSYGELLKYSPDPFGDWSRGHYARLARAELASVGLRRLPRVIDSAEAFGTQTAS